MAFFSRKPKGPFIKTSEMTMHWDAEDPFIFVSHHEDDYPHGNAQMAPPLQEISGRNLGRDYKKTFGFRMYNGKVVPGFPMHAHWGYETITLPQTGYVDIPTARATPGVSDSAMSSGCPHPGSTSTARCILWWTRKAGIPTTSRRS